MSIAKNTQTLQISFALNSKTTSTLIIRFWSILFSLRNVKCFTW